jgi:hypothetical protein
MKKDIRGTVAVAIVAAALFAGADIVAAMAESKAAVEPPRRDEFGLVPKDASDKDLALPDPHLDRNWPGPAPGQGDRRPVRIASDEDDVDPFRPEEAAPSEPAEPEAEGEPGEGAPARPPRPLIGTDGKLDAGSPTPEPEPGEADFLELDEPERNAMEQEESRPSPLDRDDSEFNDEMGDPGDW